MRLQARNKKREGQPFPLYVWFRLKRLCIPIKAQVAGALEREPAAIAFSEHAVLRPGNGKLHAIPALHLEGNIIRCGSVVMHAGAARVARNVCTFCYDDCIYREARGSVVFRPLGNAFDDRKNDYAENNYEHNHDQYRDPAKPKAHHTKIVAYPFKILDRLFGKQQGNAGFPLRRGRLCAQHCPHQKREK